MENLNKVCGICLNIIDNHKTITMDKLMNNKLHIVLPELVSQLTHISEMCFKCINELDECYNFKTLCFRTGDIIRKKVSSIDRDQKLPLTDIMQSANSTRNPLKNNLENICRTCLSSYREKYQIEDGKSLYLLQKHFPVLDLNLTLKPGICSTCIINLYKLNYFKMVYLNTENTINNYCKMFNIDYKNVNLNKVLDFDKKQKQQLLTDHLKTGKNEFLDTCEKSDTKPIDIEEKGEITSIMSIEDLQSEKDEYSYKTIKSINGNDVRLYASATKKCKRNTKDMDPHLSEHEESQSFVYKCNKCDYKTEFEYKLKKHRLSQKHKLKKCSYKCLHCSFQSAKKAHLCAHLLIHKNPDEIQMFKCRMCKFQSRQKGNLKTHLLIHKKEKKFKCNFCSFQARQKGNLQTHIRKIHKHLEEDELDEALSYKCNKCSYKAMYKPDFKKHMLSHKH